jgi:branched-chain amino acid transport system permease protein
VSTELSPAPLADPVTRRLRRPESQVLSLSARLPTVVVVIILIALIVPQVMSSPLNQNLADQWLIYALAAVGFYVIFGLAGKLSFAHGLMMAIGGYTSAWVATHVDFLAGLAAGTVAAGAVALCFGALSARLKDFYFSIASLALAYIGVQVLQNWPSFAGPNGELAVIPYPAMLGMTLSSMDDIFYLLVSVLGLALIVVVLLEDSPARRRLVAGRHNEVVARAMGISVPRAQLVAFVVGSVFAGAAGALWGAWQGNLSTTSFDINLSIGFFLMVMLGGLRSMWGALIGAAIYVFVPQWLSSASEYQDIVYGGILILIVVLFPGGIVGGARQLAKLLRRREADGKTPPTGRRGGVPAWFGLNPRAVRRRRSMTAR